MIRNKREETIFADESRKPFLNKVIYASFHNSLMMTVANYCVSGPRGFP